MGLRAGRFLSPQRYGHGVDRPGKTRITRAARRDTTPAELRQRDRPDSARSGVRRITGFGHMRAPQRQCRTPFVLGAPRIAPLLWRRLAGAVLAQVQVPGCKHFAAPATDAEFRSCRLAPCCGARAAVPEARAAGPRHHRGVAESGPGHCALTRPHGGVAEAVAGGLPPEGRRDRRTARPLMFEDHSAR